MNFTKAVLFIILSLVFLGCRKDKSLNACFTVQEQGAIGEAISFENCSVDAKSYFWEFGDGTSSEEANPTHVFSSVGTFDVHLTVKGDKKEAATVKTLSVGYVIDMHDKTIESSMPSQVDPKNSYTIDLDGDWQSDAELVYFYSYGSSATSTYFGLTLNADFEIATKRYSAVSKSWGWIGLQQDTIYETVYQYMPVMFKLSDTIKASAVFSKNGVVLYSKKGPGAQYQPKSGTVFGELIGDNYYYIGIKKTKNNKTYLGWMKLKCPYVSAITINSYLVMSEKSQLIITQ